jgi:S1-C subfamily serine protease
MARNLLNFSFNKLFNNKVIYNSKVISNHKLCQNLSRFSINSKNLFRINRNYGLIGCSSALIATIFGSKFLINFFNNNYEINHNLNNKSTNSLTQLLSELVLRRAQLFSKDNDIKSNSKQFNFIADVTEKVSSAVVFIEIKARHPFFPNADLFSISSGSGFIVREDGLILTNAHVVATYKKVLVKLFDGRVTEGIVEYVDERLDLATIKINLKDLPVIKLGDSRKSRPGEWVIALGSPFALSNTITVGVISSINRAGKELGLYKTEIDYIQTDASINIGNN